MPDLDRLINEIARHSVDRFRAENAILSFQQYLGLLFARPYTLTRSAPQYIADMMDSFGTDSVKGIGGAVRRFRVFDDPSGEGRYRVAGQEEVQNEIYRCLKEFVQRRRVDKLIMLHGPNGSAKTSIVAAIIRGLEHYSTTDDGPLLRFNWIFSEGADRGERLGFDPVRAEESLDSFAFLPAARVSAKIPCEMKDNPFFLIPRNDRQRVLDDALKAAEASERDRYVATRYVVEGDLSPKSEKIYRSLLNAYGGDWLKVMRHVQVERYYVSRRFRSAAVTIEPQGNIDAHSRQIGHANMNGMPPVLQNEMLFEASGDLVDANGGIVEYGDFFKRPLEANKYLLTTAETGTISLASYTAHLNLVLIGTGNEIYLSAFRRDPIFDSFRARLELVRVPYILEYAKESEIYERHLKHVPAEIHVAPYAAKVAALWAVLTRLMAPSGRVDTDRLRSVVERLTPVEKAELYDALKTPTRLSDEEKSLLRGAVVDLRREYDALEMEFEGVPDAAYEGRRGCSPREMMNLLTEAALAPGVKCFTPLLVLRSLKEMIRDAGLYEFLRMKRTKQGFHDASGFIEDVRGEYLKWLRDHVLAAAELVDEAEFSRLFRTYFLNVKAHETGEKVIHEKTGKAQDPDRDFMEQMERLLGMQHDPALFRSNLMTRAAAFKLSHPTELLVYESVFADEFRVLYENYFRERMKRVEQLVTDTTIITGHRPGSIDHERRAAAERFNERFQTRFHYCPNCAAECLEFFLENIADLA